jgi:hypothetical protein
MNATILLDKLGKFQNAVETVVIEEKFSSLSEGTQQIRSLDSTFYSDEILQLLFNKVDVDFNMHRDITLVRLFTISSLFRYLRETRRSSSPLFSFLSEICEKIAKHISILTEWMCHEDQIISYMATTTLAEICYSVNYVTSVSDIASNRKILNEFTQELYKFLLQTLLKSQHQLTTNQKYNILKFFVTVIKHTRKNFAREDESEEKNTHDEGVVMNISKTSPVIVSSNTFPEVFKIIRLIQPEISQLFRLFCQQKENEIQLLIPFMTLMINILKCVEQCESRDESFASTVRLSISQQLHGLTNYLTLSPEHDNVVLLQKKVLVLCLHLTEHLSLSSCYDLVCIFHRNVFNIMSASIRLEPPSFSKESPAIVQRLFLLAVLKLVLRLLEFITTATNNDESVLKVWGLLSELAGVYNEVMKRQQAAVTQSLFVLFQEQDDALIEVLFLLFKLYTNLTRVSQVSSNVTASLTPFLSTFASVLHPHLLFTHFLASISYDYSVLLDFLISNETQFLPYFLFYLKYCVANWQEFVSIVTQQDSKRDLSPQTTRLSSHHSRPQFEFRELTNKSKEDRDIASYFQSRLTLSEGDEVPSPIISTQTTTNSLVFNYTNESEEESGEIAALDRVVGVLIRLKLAIERLVKKNLFPYNVRPLLRRLQEIEEEYEHGQSASDTNFQ